MDEIVRAIDAACEAADASEAAAAANGSLVEVADDDEAVNAYIAEVAAVHGIEWTEPGRRRRRRRGRATDGEGADDREEEEEEWRTQYELFADWRATPEAGSTSSGRASRNR